MVQSNSSHIYPYVQSPALGSKKFTCLAFSFCASGSARERRKAPPQRGFSILMLNYAAAASTAAVASMETNRPCWPLFWNFTHALTLA